MAVDDILIDRTSALIVELWFFLSFFYFFI
jgi:hypothetical protein